ncbi:MAG: hypothetical protein ACOZQL_40540 [Myxococcota bacterium]
MSTASIPTWQRSAFQPGGAPNVFQLFCFSSGPLADVPLSASRFGLPAGEVMKSVEVRELPRSIDAGWFDAFRQGSLRAIAAQALGGDLSALDAATQLTAVLISRPDAADLAHLQAGWAVAKWLVARGVSVLLDAQTNRFWKGEDVADWPAVRPFALSTDVNVVVEAEPTSPRATIHTRGLQKFGRPDLVVLDVPGERWDAVAGLVRVVAANLADGAVFTPGQQLTVGADTLRFSRFEAAPGAELHLNNDALLISAA